jgi:hypothetical protein
METPTAAPTTTPARNSRGARGEEPTPEPVRAPQRERVERQHREPHERHDVGALAEHAHERRREQVEERHVVVEDVAVLDEAVRPSPGDVQVLRLVGIDAVVEGVERA